MGLCLIKVIKVTVPLLPLKFVYNRNFIYQSHDIHYAIVLKKQNLFAMLMEKNGDVYTLYTTEKKTCIYIIYK